jgi:hypothetical protein
MRLLNLLAHLLNLRCLDELAVRRCQRDQRERHDANNTHRCRNVQLSLHPEFYWYARHGVDEGTGRADRDGRAGHLADVVDKLPLSSDMAWAALGIVLVGRFWSGEEEGWYGEVGDGVAQGGKCCAEGDTGDRGNKERMGRFVGHVDWVVLLGLTDVVTLWGGGVGATYIQLGRKLDETYHRRVDFLASRKHASETRLVVGVSGSTSRTEFKHFPVPR